MNAYPAVRPQASHVLTIDRSPTRVHWPQVVGFTALAYAMSWAWWAPLVWPYLERVTLTGPPPNALAEAGAGRAALGMFGPAIAALIMRRWHHELFRGSMGVRRPWKYYLVAVAGPALFVGSVVVIDTAAGLGRFEWPQSPMLTFAAVLFIGGAVSLPLTIGEEYGWRGYLLPRLLPLGQLKGTLLLSAIWAIWHVPILLIGLNYPGQPLWAVLLVFTASVVLLAFPFTWLYVASGSSVLVVAVMHSVLNALGDTFTSAGYIPDGNPLIVSAGGVIGAAILLVVVAVGAAISVRQSGGRRLASVGETASALSPASNARS